MRKTLKAPTGFKPCPSQERLRQLFDYDLVKGVLIWRRRPPEEFKNITQHRAWNGRLSGRVAGYTALGYRWVGIGNEKFLAHRLVWVWHFGDIPDGMLIDHEDGDGLNNRLGNLKLATNSQNQRNLKPRARSATGVRGVYFSKRLRCYVASYSDEGKTVHLGVFGDLAKAKLAADSARKIAGYSDRHRAAI